MSLVKTLNFQFAALPYRQRDDGTIEVMLITSRDTGRWVVPKGWPSERETAWDCAAREAHEEAGLVGEIRKRPVGSYHYKKMLENGFPVWCTVEVFALEVSQQASNWEEQGERACRWFALEDAAGAVDETELGSLIRGLPHYLDTNRE
jgi:8-oxo-dGTP pyrophosphatase MutT (NUDIX family)